MTEKDKNLPISLSTSSTPLHPPGETLFSEPLTTDWVKISLTPILTLFQLNELKKQLLQCRGQRVQLLGAKVERVDTATLQLLLAFINSPEVTVGWIEPSPELCTAARLLGLSSQLNLPTIDLAKPF